MTFRELTDAERLEHLRTFIGAMVSALGYVVENVTAGDLAGAAIDHAQSVEWAREAAQALADAAAKR